MHSDLSPLEVLLALAPNTVRPKHRGLHCYLITFYCLGIGRHDYKGRWRTRQA